MTTILAACVLWIPVYCVGLIVQSFRTSPRHGSRRQLEELEIQAWNNRRLQRMHRFNQAYQRRMRS